MMAWPGVICSYKKYLPVSDATPVISLLEGNTPLVRSQNIEKIFGGKLSVYFKLEGQNPTGSFKDRGMCMAVSKALESGSKAIICASTGNTSASASAYAARAQIRCVVLLPKGAIALGKLAQALMHGAMVIAIEGSFDDALAIVKKISQDEQFTLVNSINPFRLQGQKTAAFEICDALDHKAPDYHFLPVGNAGNIVAYWMGYREYHSSGLINQLPRMIGFQAEGSAPIVKGHIIEKPQTLATAIRIGNPANWKGAIQAAEESNGLIDAVSDENILEAYHMLADQEGILAEPASAASLAGLLKLFRTGYFNGEKSLKTVVCTLTGHGLKDPDCAIQSVKSPITMPPDEKRIIELIKERGKNNKH
ncbi:MAG: threonine synthase [Chlamydiota bacterium]|nr:threonine synthase [Chlamydiota bacterium]